MRSLLPVLVLAAVAAAQEAADFDLATETERARSALRAIQAKDAAAAGEVLGAEVTEKSLESWAPAVAKRLRVLEDLAEIQQIRRSIPDKEELKRRQDEARATLLAPADQLPPELVGAGVQRLADAVVEADAAEAAAQSTLREELARRERLEESAKGIPGRRLEISDRLRELQEGNPLDEYRRRTLAIERRLLDQKTGLLETETDRWDAWLQVLRTEADAAKAFRRRLSGAVEAASRIEAERLSAVEADHRKRAAEIEADLSQVSDPVERYRMSVDARIQLLAAEEMADRRGLLTLDTKLASEKERNESLQDRKVLLESRFAEHRSATGRAGETLVRALKRTRNEAQALNRRLVPELEELSTKYGRRSDEVQDELLELDTPPEEAPEDLARLLAETPAEEQQAATAAFLKERVKLREPLTRRERVLERIQDELGKLAAVYDLRAEAVGEMRAFVLSRIYWVRNAPPIGRDTLVGIGDEIANLAVLYTSSSLLGAAVDTFRGNEVRSILTAVGFLVLVCLGVWLHLRLRKARSRRQYRGARPLAVIQRILVAMFFAVSPPACIAAAALLLLQLGMPAPLEEPAIRLLVGLAALLFLRRLFRSLFREKEGIFESEFGVRPEVTAQLRRSGHLFLLTGLILFLPWWVLSSPVLRITHLTRILYPAMVACFGIIVLMAVRRSSAVVRSLTGGQGLFHRFWPFIWLFLALMTLAMVVMDVVGFRYGSNLMLQNLTTTAAFLLALYLAYQGVSRFVEQTAQRVLRRRDEATDADEARRESQEVLQQASRVFSTALVVAGIFVLVTNIGLGATLIRGLEDVRITLTNAETGTWLTLWDVVVAILWVLGTHFLLRNLKGLFEVLVFPRLGRSDAGTRFVVLTVSKYLIFVVGYAGAILALHFEFSSLAWLLAAASVGLGFGLQEIVANFVSGLILFFERPIRVGDVVTVGDLTGTVDQISIRATQIVAFTRQVIIIPNRSFIVGDVVNWSHNDNLMRRSVYVGVAYGSDVEKVTRILLEVARESRKVRDRPAPRVLFTAFGNSSLDFELQVYAEIADRFIVESELNRAIDAKFAEEGVEIPFPQRDLHLRSVQDAATLRALGGKEED